MHYGDGSKNGVIMQTQFRRCHEVRVSGWHYIRDTKTLFLLYRRRFRCHLDHLQSVVVNDKLLELLRRSYDNASLDCDTLRLAKTSNSSNEKPFSTSILNRYVESKAC